MSTADLNKVRSLGAEVTLRKTDASVGFVKSGTKFETLATVRASVPLVQGGRINLELDFLVDDGVQTLIGAPYTDFSSHVSPVWFPAENVPVLCTRDPLYAGLRCFVSFGAMVDGPTII